MSEPAGVRVEVKLFGEASVLASGTAVRLSPMQLALIAVTYGSGEVTRAWVTKTLWSGAEDARARQRLRQLLLSTNGRIGARIIDAAGDTLRPRDGLECDVDVVRRGLEGRDLRPAAECLAKGFVPTQLPGLSSEFDDWRDDSARRWRQGLERRARSEWSRAMREGAVEEARDAAEALYVLDRRDPRVVAMVIEARGRAGRFGAAEAAYASYRERGGKEDADIETVMLRVRAIANRLDGEARPRTVPLVGRDPAMRAIRRALDRVAAGRFAFVLVSGEAGIGKTRVLEEGRREAVLRGFRCLSAKAVEIERIIPLNPLLDALRGLDLRPHLQALGPPWNAVINSALPAGTYDAVVGEVPPIQESGLSRRLLDSLSMLLERLALEQPTILFLDDLHWVDATTIAALQFFQRRWTHGPFGVFASVRPEQVVGSDPAAVYLRGAADLAVEEIALGELAHEDALALIDEIAEGRLDDDARTRVCALAGPHPLYLTELTRDLLSGDLELPEPPADEVPIPVSLQQILRARLDDLSDPATRVARVLAVAARPLRLADLAGLSRMSADECSDRLEELQHKRLVEVERDAAQMAHDLFRSAIYKDIPAARLALIHRTIAEQILAEGSEDSHGELAIHFGRAGESVQAASHAWKAASRAWENGAMAEAAHFFELVTEHEIDQVKRAQATAGLARALHLNRDIARANPLLELAAARLRAVGDSAQARRMDIRRVEGLMSIGSAPLGELVERLGITKAEARAESDFEALAWALDAELRLLNRRGDIAAMGGVFDELRSAACQADGDAAAMCYAGLALQALFGDPTDGLTCASRAVALARNDRDTRLIALTRLLIVLQCQGRMLQPAAQPILEEARNLAHRSGDLRTRVAVESNAALAYLDAGEIDHAEVLMERSDRLLGRASLDLGRFNQSNNRAELALAKGDYREAARIYGAAAATFGAWTPGYARDLANAGLGLCALETGNLSEARRRESELGPDPQLWFFDPTTILAFRAKILERRGLRGSAIDLLAANRDRLQERHVLAWMKVTDLLVRVMVKDGRSGATELAEAARSVAQELGLSRREADFRRLCDLGER